MEIEYDIGMHISSCCYDTVCRNYASLLPSNLCLQFWRSKRNKKEEKKTSYNIIIVKLNGVSLLLPDV